MKAELQAMRDKLKALGLRVSQSNFEGSHGGPKRSRSQLNMQQECDFEDGMEEADNLLAQTERQEEPLSVNRKSG